MHCIAIAAFRKINKNYWLKYVETHIDFQRFKERQQKGLFFWKISNYCLIRAESYRSFLEQSPPSTSDVSEVPTVPPINFHSNKWHPIFSVTCQYFISYSIKSYPLTHQFYQQSNPLCPCSYWLHLINFNHDQTIKPFRGEAHLRVSPDLNQPSTATLPSPGTFVSTHCLRLAFGFKPWRVAKVQNHLTTKR